MKKFIEYLTEARKWTAKNGIFQVWRELDEDNGEDKLIFNLNNERLGIATKTESGYSCELPSGKKFLVDGEKSLRKLAEQMFKESGRFDVKKLSRQGCCKKVGLS